jgi:hypothetical protein
MKDKKTLSASLDHRNSMFMLHFHFILHPSAVILLFRWPNPCCNYPALNLP